MDKDKEKDEIPVFDRYSFFGLLAIILIFYLGWCCKAIKGI
ncbi:hypothetical protein N0O92_09845 [Alkalihalobacillus sp. MEB130]|nr:hypothetical protein [Alkalihalobacillus sp. MEB130]MDT8860536.1 hypothetical protein [Alkalihalobacillus sp. MEB130]